MGLDRASRIALFGVAVVLVGCGESQRHSVADGVASPAGHGPVWQRVTGHETAEAPLEPEPGDIWADILPSRTPAESATLAPRSTASAAQAAAAAPPSVVGPQHGTDSGAQERIAGGQPHLVQSPDTAAAQSRSIPRATPVQPNVGPVVQLAAAGSAADAELAWQRLRQRHPQLVVKTRPMVQQTELNGHTVWRLRAGGFDTVAAARKFCADMRAVQSDCWVVAPVGRP